MKEGASGRGQFCVARKGTTLYTIDLAGEQEQAAPPQVRLPFLLAKVDSRVQLLGCSQACRFQATDAGVTIEVPTATRENPPCQRAWTFRLQSVEIVQPR